MSYKYRIYTCDIRFERNEPTKKKTGLFKSETCDNWIEEYMSIANFLYVGYLVYRISDSEESVEQIFNSIIDKKRSERYTYGLGTHKVRNVNIENIREIKVPIKDLIKHFDSEKVIKWISERGINSINVSV